jgi:hypothetical protein
VFDVVRFGQSGADPIPAYLQCVLGPSGYICSSAKGKADIQHYGFLFQAVCGTPLNGTG